MSPNSNGITNIYFTLSKYNTTTSTETLISTSGYSGDINGTTAASPDMFTITCPVPDMTYTTNDRIVLRLYTNGNGMNGSATVTTVFQGAYYSNMLTPIISGSSLLLQNNTWTGTNTFSNTTYISNQLVSGTISGNKTALNLGDVSYGVIVNGDLYVNKSIILPAILHTNPSQIGWTLKSAGSITSTVSSSGVNILWTGTFTNLSTGVKLPIGVYLITFNGGVNITSTVNGGTLTEVGSGYCNSSSYNSTTRTNVTTITNTNYPIFTKTLSYYPFTWSHTESVNINNYYLSAYIYVTLSSSFSNGSFTNIIQDYTIARIG